MASHERTNVKLFPTASATDVLFYVTVNSDLPKNKAPVYGDSYRTSFPHAPEDFPNHNLVFISPSGARGDSDSIQRWYFAADRASEDNYNYQFTEGRELIRAYLVRRDLYYARTAAEAAVADPLVAGEFTVPVVATADSKFAKYGFADDTLLEAPEELRSLYVVVQRRFLRPVVSEIRYDDDLAIRLKDTYTMVPATYTEDDLPADAAGEVYELEPVNAFHSRQVKRAVVPESGGWTLADYSRTQGVRTNIPNIPRELVSVNVVWNSSYDIGQQDYAFFKWQTGSSLSLGKSASDSASSAASVVPELQLKFRDLEASNLPATEYEIFIEGDATEAAVLARLTALAGGSVLAWPVFRPESVTISTTGQSINVRSNVQISLEGSWNSTDGLTSQGWDKGTSDDFGVNLSVGSVQIPPCIHGAITLTGDTTMSIPVAATAFMSMVNSLVGSISATRTQSKTATGSVTPTSIDAVSGTTSIPTSGLYALDIRPGRNFLGYTHVTAVVLNASTLA